MLCIIFSNNIKEQKLEKQKNSRCSRANLLGKVMTVIMRLYDTLALYLIINEKGNTFLTIAVLVLCTPQINQLQNIVI